MNNIKSIILCKHIYCLQETMCAEKQGQHKQGQHIKKD